MPDDHSRSSFRHRRPSKPGRPRSAPSDLRSVRIRLHLTPDEERTFQSLAEECAMPLSVYIRTAALGDPIRPLTVPKANLIYVDELNRLGNNLNQLLVLIYTNRAPLGLLSTLEELQRIVEEVKATLLGEEDSL